MLLLISFNGIVISVSLGGDEKRQSLTQTGSSRMGTAAKKSSR